MNKSLALLSITLLLATASSVFAASSVDLTVNGLITPSACTPTMPGVIDYGKISAKDLNPDKQTRLEQKTISLSVSCEAMTLFAIKPIDNRAGSSSSTSHSAYGLGLINDTEKLGNYMLAFRNPVADIPSQMLSFSEGRWRWLGSDDAVMPDTLVALGDYQEDLGYLPHPLQSASMEIVIYTYIAATNTLTLTNEVALDGSTTMEVKYL